MATNPSGSFGGHVVIDPRKLAEFMRSPSGPTFRYLIEVGEKVKTEAMQECPVFDPPDAYTASHRARRPGTLRDSIVKRVTTLNGQPAVLVGSDDPVALWVHEGTVPHVIAAVRAPMLVFFWKRLGRVVAFLQVNHPGTQPNRFLVRALANVKGRL
jgi:hypothetical protein